MILADGKELYCKKISIGEHSFQRMFERNINPGDVIDIVRTGEVIFEYSYDKPYPSYLILKFVKSKPIHVVVARNEADKFCFVVTVYEPNPKLWSADFKTKIV
ncbi:MAG: DUF4258 domain-containing protein [Segetibacter sp.]